MPEATVFNIQKYCVHDGDGIRTTIFFKGCPLSCRWCHNPESRRFRPQLMVYPERCDRCGRCCRACRRGCITMTDEILETDLSACTACGLCARTCMRGAREIMGNPYTVEELVRIAGQDKMFYETSGGGVTLSGGEVMSQTPEFLVQLVRAFKLEGLSVAIDTCGFAPLDSFKRVFHYTDTFLYDIKLLDRERHILYTGQDNDLILSNLKWLSDMGAHLQIRIPVIEGVNANDPDMDDICCWLRDNIQVDKICLLPYHNIGMDKYARLGLTAPSYDFRAPNEQRMLELATRFREFGFQCVQIGG